MSQPRRFLMKLFIEVNILNTTNNNRPAEQQSVCGIVIYKSSHINHAHFTGWIWLPGCSITTTATATPSQVISHVLILFL